jgi:hypothetical protein
VHAIAPSALLVPLAHAVQESLVEPAVLLERPAVHAQQDVALAKEPYVPGGHAAQVSPALPKRPAAHCDSGGTAKSFDVTLLPSAAPLQRAQDAPVSDQLLLPTVKVCAPGSRHRGAV